MPRLNFRRWRAQKSSIKSCLIKLAENVGFANDSRLLFLDWLLLWPRGPVSVIRVTHSQMSSKADHSASSGMFPSIRLPSFLWNSHRNFLQYCSFRRYFLTKITAQPAVQYCKHEAIALSVPKNYRLFEAIILLNPCPTNSNYHLKAISEASSWLLISRSLSRSTPPHKIEANPSC